MHVKTVANFKASSLHEETKDVSNIQTSLLDPCLAVRIIDVEILRSCPSTLWQFQKSKTAHIVYHCITWQKNIANNPIITRARANKYPNIATLRNRDRQSSQHRD